MRSLAHCVVVSKSTWKGSGWNTALHKPSKAVARALPSPNGGKAPSESRQLTLPLMPSIEKKSIPMPPSVEVEFTPTMDLFEREAVGGCKPNFTHEVVKYFQEHPGTTVLKAAYALASTFSAHFKDVNDGMSRMTDKISRLCSPSGNHKKQRLRKVSQPREPLACALIYPLEY